MSDNPNYDSRFDNDYYYLVETDFTNDGKLVCSDKDKDKIFLVMIFATWCGNCTKAKDEYSDMINNIDKNKVKLCLINGSTDRGKVPTSQDETLLIKRLKNVVPGFVGFPSFVIFKSTDGSNVLSYVDTHKGERKVESLKNTLNKNM